MVITHLCKSARSGDPFALRKRLAESSPRPTSLIWDLCFWAGFGRVDYVKALLEYRVSPNLPSPETGRNALHEACLWPKGERVVALLLQHRADPSLTAKLKSKTMNAYQMALHHGNQTVAKIIQSWDCRFEHHVSEGIEQMSATPTVAHPVPPWRQEPLTSNATTPLRCTEAATSSWNPLIGCSECGSAAAAATSQYCDRCGAKLDAGESAESMGLRLGKKLEDVIIQGFRPNPEERFVEADLCSEKDWDNLRRAITSSLKVKTEPGSSDDDDSAGDVQDEVRTIPIDRIFNIQRWCTDHFQDKRPLTVTIDDLKTRRIHHLEHPKFVLNVVMARIRNPRGGKKEMFWTCDHRRLVCMRSAGCAEVRVRIKLRGPVFDEFMNKGAKDDLGTRTGIEVKRRRL